MRSLFLVVALLASPSVSFCNVNDGVVAKRTPKDWVKFCRERHIEVGTVRVMRKGKDGRDRLVHAFNCSTRPQAGPDGRVVFIDFSGEIPESEGDPIVLVMPEWAVWDFVPDSNI